MASSVSSTIVTHSCPYALCEVSEEPARSSLLCSCELRRVIVVCPKCSARNRAGAHYCRKCRSDLDSSISKKVLSGTPPQADFMSLRGCIRRPPLLMNGQLYVLDTAGKLFEIAPRAEAQPREVARLKSGEAGFNSGAIVEAAASAKGLRGHLYLAVSSSRLEAVSLDTGNITVLYEPREGESILANSSEADSTAFKGVTAAPGCAAIAVRTAARE